MAHRPGGMDVVLHPRRERSVTRRHPWLLSGALARVPDALEPGDLVRVRSAEGEVLAHGWYSPASQIRVRLVEFGKQAPPEGWLERRIQEGVARRTADASLADTDALRLINAEGDGLPGITADRYGDMVVLRLTSVGAVRRRESIAKTLREATGAAAGLERADTSAARREDFPAREGELWGERPEMPLWIQEGDRRYAVDVLQGQKTGFYLDQRDARDFVQRAAAGRRCLDLFSYSGGFAVAAARGGAKSLTLVDSSADALALAGSNLEANQVACPVRSIQQDAFRFVREDDDLYDLIVVDPPALAQRRAGVSRASRALKDILLRAMGRAAPDAMLACFSCSHHVGADLFRKIVFAASLDAGRRLQVAARLGAPSDHPVSIDHPEGEYLNGLVLRVQ